MRRKQDPFEGDQQWRRQRRWPFRTPGPGRLRLPAFDPPSPERLSFFAGLAVVAVAAFVLILTLTGGDGSADEHDSGTVTTAPDGPLHAAEFERRRIYHSPQTPGYTAWVGAWIGPGPTLMTAFTQATGPIASPPDHEFAGLEMSAIILSSSDDGETWETVRADAFEGPPYAYTGQATLGLDDGTILRRVNGEDLIGFADVPQTAYLERLEPGAESWSGRQTLLDPDRYTYNVSRIQYLSDGTLIASGNFWEVPAGTRDDSVPADQQGWLLMASDDDGETWRQALTVPDGYAPQPNEWDLAELPEGDLLAMMRTFPDPETGEQFRRQAILRREGDGWVMERSQPAPFPHSGHPELLRTSEGAILHIATSGIDYTTDGGESWKPLPFTSGAEYHSGYYPSAVEADDGTIYVFSHVGADDAYGARDQAILLDSFDLATGEVAR